MFMNKNLSVIAYANGFTLWHYKSNETMKEITEPSYFVPVKNLMHTGDIIIINAKEETAIRKLVLADNKVKVKDLD